ncbi:F-box protein FBW2-like isoform X1 [Musa acuminata AAA Group]|uniref:F-box protein FBW2-like isoform X1 n=1 Tax=Musa acuminata AAA Group TaxID=214697 RepID=UPI0031D02D64
MEEGRRWEDMQVDCLVNIFRRLGLDDLTVSVPFVCTCWWRASLDPVCWRVLNLRSLDFRTWSQFSRSFGSRYRLKTLSFSAFLRLVVHRSHGSASELIFPLSSGASVHDLAYVSINSCPGLRTLALPDKLMLEDDLRIPELIGRWKDLEQLELETKPTSFLETVAAIGHNCTRFARLKVRGLIGKEDASVIAMCLPELKQLELSGSYLTKDELAVIVSGCRKLERLTATDCLGFQADEELLRLASGIHSFEHEGSKLLSDNGYETDESEQQSGFFYW